jgi:hypothetical protein
VQKSIKFFDKETNNPFLYFCKKSTPLRFFQSFLGMRQTY